MMDWSTQIFLVTTGFALVAVAYLIIERRLERKARLRREYIALVTRQAAAAIAQRLGDDDANSTEAA